MSDSEDDVPLALRRSNPPSQPLPQAPKPKPAVQPKKTTPATAPKRKAESDDGDDDDSDSEAASSSGGEDMPLSERKDKVKRQRSSSAAGGGSQPRATRGSRASAEPGKSSSKNGQIMWKTLKHHGVLFPPEYEPHGVKMLYDGKPVDLTPEQEEVASMFAVMKETDYMNKPTFLKNFWEGFQEVLGPGHVIKVLDKCDFAPMYDHFMAEREKKKAEPKEVKAKNKSDRDAAEAKYKIAHVDGTPQDVGNFRVEPPGLFRGRGEHPRMGKIKKRVYPRDITINIGKGEPIPTHPYPGQTWKEVRHDQTVTWLAFWKDTISEKEYKYVFLGATSTFKADSDLAKYEKARKLKDLIVGIRKNYEQDWDSTDTKKRQMAVALYFLDKLALRAGHEKDEDEADTVGCCTLKCENVEMIPPNHIKFDFLGKDSIKYENTVEVHKKVYAQVEKFKTITGQGKRKGPTDQLFETFDATDLNKELKSIMDGLSVKVFRTYNASITLDRLLREQDEVRQRSMPTEEKKAEYDLANKEVAILCNHQRAVGKAHGDQMEKLQKVLQDLNNELKDLKDDLKKATKEKSDTAGIQKKIERKKDQISKKELQARSKEEMKTVALGTSKINYMDPRITIAWCKRNEVPLEKVFNKSLLAKFNWAMTVEPKFIF